MLRELVEYLVGLKPTTRFNIDPKLDRDAALWDRKVFRTPPPDEVPLAKPLEVATLRSFVEYLKANVDKLDFGDHLIHVVDPTRVELVSKLETFHRRREPVLAAVYPSEAAKYLDQWLELEVAVIALLSQFTPAGDRDAVLSALKSIVKEDAEIRDDDGVSQNVTVKSGVVTKDRVTLPNPVTLASFRTFPEVTSQPMSQFVLRLSGAGTGVKVLLKGADGAAWKVEAVDKVADRLTFYMDAAKIKDRPAIIF